MSRFDSLSKTLSQLRLDPTMQITSEDPITTIVKAELKNRKNLESFTKMVKPTENLKKEVDDILNNLFSNKK